MEAYHKYKGRDVVFVSLTPDEKHRLADVKKFVEKYGIVWPTGYDAEDTLMQFEVRYYPALWVIDREGNIVWNTDTSGLMGDAIENALQIKPRHRGVLLETSCGASAPDT